MFYEDDLCPIVCLRPSNTTREVLMRQRRNDLRGTKCLHIADLPDAGEQYGERVDEMFATAYDRVEAISKFFSKALRHEPFHHDQESRRFNAAISSWGPVDGWAEVDQLVEELPGHENDNLHITREEIHPDYAVDPEYKAYLLVRIAGMLDHNGMIKSRLQLKRWTDPRGNAHLHACYKWSFVPRHKRRGELIREGRRDLPPICRRRRQHEY